MKQSLSYMQEAIIVHETMSGQPIYAMPWQWRITGRLDIPALRAAFALACGRHPALCASYTRQGAVITPETRARLAWRAAESLDADETLGTGASLLAGPPVRAELTSTSADHHRLTLTMHHVAGDSWSAGILFREIRHAYEQCKAGTLPEFRPDPAPDFFEFAAGERAREIDTSWWQGYLSAAPVADYLVQDLMEAAPASRVPLPIRAAETRAVKRLAAQAKVSPSAVLFAAASLAIARERGARESVLGLASALRETRERQDVIGPLLNIIPVRTTWNPAMDSLAVLGQHARAFATAIAHSDVPLALIMRSAPGSSRRKPARLAHVVNIDSSAPRLQLAGARVEDQRVPPAWAIHPAEWVFSWESVWNIAGEVRLDEHVYGHGRGLAFAAAFGESLRWLVSGAAAS